MILDTDYALGPTAPARIEYDEPRMQMELVLFNGKPFAYVQAS